MPTLPTTGSLFADDLAGWQRLLAEPDPACPPGPATTSRSWPRRAHGAEAALAGDRLVHGDARADNLLVRRDGSVVVVDWPYASRCAGWFDRLCLLVNVGLNDPSAPLDAMVDRWLPDVRVEDVDAVLAGLAGYFCDVARRPDPPGLPTVRAFQRAQGAVVLRWLRWRWGARAHR